MNTEKKNVLEISDVCSINLENWFRLNCSKDWVDVANDLICKCRINLRIQKLTECDASVFVALYEAILGEKVPGKCTFNAMFYARLYSTQKKFNRLDDVWC